MSAFLQRFGDTFNRLRKRLPRTPLAKAKEELADLREQAHNEYLQNIGMFVTVWSSIEMLLDYWNWMILNLVDGNNELYPSLPRSLNKKIDLFKTSHGLQSVSGFRINGLAIIDEIHRLKDQRHDIIHGNGRLNVKDLSHEFERLKLEGKGFRTLSKVYSIEELRDLLRDANNLLGRLNDHVRGLLNRVRPLEK